MVNGHGSTTPTAGTHTYIEGLRVSIKATPDSGWKFDGWTGDAADPALAETTVTMLSNKAVTANFSPIQHDLKIDVSGKGSITPAVGIHSYDEGTIVNIVAKADGGWKFDGWTGDAVDSVLAETTVTMLSDKAITANFSKAKPSMWLIGGIAAGIAIISTTIWLVRRYKLHH